MDEEFDYSFTNKFKIGDQVRVVNFEGRDPKKYYTEEFINYIFVVEDFTDIEKVFGDYDGNARFTGYLIIDPSGNHFDSSKYFENELELVKKLEIEELEDEEYNELFI